MSKWTVKAENGKERQSESRSEAEEIKHDMESLGLECEIIPPTESDGGTAMENYGPGTPCSQCGEEIEPFMNQNVEYCSKHIPESKSDGGAEIVAPETEEKPTEEPNNTRDKLPEEHPGVKEDPVNWLPSHFIDDIQGTPTVNRKGYAVIASQYGVSVTSEPITLPSETDFEYAEFRATAITRDGKEYSGFGSAHVDRQDGDDPQLLGELAETRAMKRAVAWATGVGMTAIEEMMGNKA